MYFKIAIGNVHKSIRDYGIYFITLVFGVCVFYAFNSITQQSAVLEFSASQREMLQLLSALIGGVSVFIAIVLGFLIVYASRYLIRRRKKEFGTYLLLGMPTGKVSRIIIYETLLVGLFSLVVGLVVGVGLSQLLLYVSAALFEVSITTFNFVVSSEALVMTVVYFAAIFLVALIFNTVTVSHYKLINLINAEKKNEGIKLRNIPLSIAFFLIAVAMIGVAYYLLIDNGMSEINDQFTACTVLVCAGTVLLFYSLAGFLLRAVQSKEKLYLRGLNMFILRQLNSKINTAFISISLVCIILFLAIMSICGGFGMVTSFNNSLTSATVYDASFVYYYGDGTEVGDSGGNEEAAKDDFDMQRAFERQVEGWDTLVAHAAQVDLYVSDANLQDMVDATDYSLNESLYRANFSERYLEMVSISDFNDLRVLNDLEPIDLASDGYMLWSDSEEIKGLYEAFLDQHDSITVAGQKLYTADEPLQTLSLRTAAAGMLIGAVIVPDEVIPVDSPYTLSCLNVMYNGEREKVEPLFQDAVDKAYGGDNKISAWPFYQAISAVQMYEQNVGLTAIITYLAIYIGFVLLIACAAILALQQLSEAADNVLRYSLLEKIGVEHSMMNKALLTQIGIYFVFPLVVALCHSGVALYVLNNVLSLIGISNLSVPIMVTLALLVLVYGGYFLVTYFGSRSIVHQKITSC